MLLTISGVIAWVRVNAVAQETGRRTTIVVPYQEHEWWLSRWTDNQILCRIIVDHEGLPTRDEVLQACGGEIQSQWLNTPPCMKVIKEGADTTSCAGLYLFLVSSTPKEREVIIDLPLAEVWVSLEGCTPTPPDNRCTTLPALLLTGIEPLPNEQITSISGTFDGEPFICEGTDRCAIPLRVTPTEGVLVEFWAESSYGDTSELFTAHVRVIDSGVATAPGGGGWFVDVLSKQWRGDELASCSQTWEAFPTIGGLPSWLSTPEHTDLMASDEPYYYLAGRLINQEIVDASTCPTGGLLPNGYADACGLEAARPIVQEWQNQFDARIIEVSAETGVPAQLMKNLFAQESQFWPGVFRVQYEFGLGQITDNGADTVLLWNQAFFEQFCPLVLSAEACSGGYLQLNPADQEILRGALALQAKADCPECPTGLDLTNVDFSLGLFANTIKANCDQVAQIIYTATKERPGALASYEDLWRFTLANYHAGPGCVSFAIHQAWQSGSDQLTWEAVSSKFTEPCQGVIPYVEKIAR